MNDIKQWWFARRLKTQKQRAIFEITQDLKYIETFKKGMLDYDETNARRRMSELKKVEEKNDAQHQELENILDIISQSKATKNEYEKSKALLSDLENYISIL